MNLKLDIKKNSLDNQHWLIYLKWVKEELQLKVYLKELNKKIKLNNLLTVSVNIVNQKAMNVVKYYINVQEYRVNLMITMMRC